MTQAPQAVPAGWYPSPDGAPVFRWWDGAMWTDATQPYPQAAPGPLPAPVEPGPAASGWVAQEPPRLGMLALITRVFVVVAGFAAPVAMGAQLWRQADPPEWLTEDVARGSAGAASGLLLVAALFWCVWQYRVARSFPPGTPRRTPGWQVLSWLVPVAAWWLPLQNIGDLFGLATGRRPRWLVAWWVLWLAGILVGLLGVVQPWLGLAGTLLTLAAMPFAVLVVGRLTRATELRREHFDA